MSTNGVFRAFIAIDLPEDLKTTINSLINTLREAVPAEIKWVLMKKLHLTLKFLGNISLEQQSVLAAGVEKALGTIKPFTLDFSTIFLFPSNNDPHALALKPDPMEPLCKLAAILDEQALRIGIPPENRVYTPHLTLGRIYEQPPAIPKITLPNLKFTVDGIKLFRSDFLSYTMLQHFALVFRNFNVVAK